jgi:hypothetical protein
LFINGNIRSSIRECEWNTEQFAQAHTQFLPSFRWDEEQHESSTTGTKQFSADGTSAQAGLVDIVNITVRYLLG